MVDDGRARGAVVGRHDVEMRSRGRRAPITTRKPGQELGPAGHQSRPEGFKLRATPGWSTE
jgi:hypothetical protein